MREPEDDPPLYDETIWLVMAQRGGAVIPVAWRFTSQEAVTAQAAFKASDSTGLYFVVQVSNGAFAAVESPTPNPGSMSGIEYSLRQALAGVYTTDAYMQSAYQQVDRLVACYAQTDPETGALSNALYNVLVNVGPQQRTLVLSVMADRSFPLPQTLAELVGDIYENVHGAYRNSASTALANGGAHGVAVLEARNR